MKKIEFEICRTDELIRDRAKEINNLKNQHWKHTDKEHTDKEHTDKEHMDWFKKILSLMMSTY